MITETHFNPIQRYLFQVPDGMFTRCYNWDEHFIIEYSKQKNLLQFWVQLAVESFSGVISTKRNLRTQDICKYDDQDSLHWISLLSNMKI